MKRNSEWALSRWDQIQRNDRRRRCLGSKNGWVNLFALDLVPKTETKEVRDVEVAFRWGEGRVPARKNHRSWPCSSLWWLWLSYHVHAVAPPSESYSCCSSSPSFALPVFVSPLKRHTFPTLHILENFLFGLWSFIEYSSYRFCRSFCYGLSKILGHGVRLLCEFLMLTIYAEYSSHICK